MKHDEFLHRILRPGLETVQEVCGLTQSPDAERFLLAIAQQESGLQYRYQRGTSPRYPGPARGWWQFEQGGGVAGVLRHPSSANKASMICDHYAVEHDQAPIWRALEGHDGLAVAFARLLVWTDPYKLPRSEKEGWDYYIRCWRPGKPHPGTWGGCWSAATTAVTGCSV